MLPGINESRVTRVVVTLTPVVLKPPLLLIITHCRSHKELKEVSILASNEVLVLSLVEGWEIGEKYEIEMVKGDERRMREG